MEYITFFNYKFMTGLLGQTNVVSNYLFFCFHSPVAGSPMEDEYNLQDHSDLYILDLGKQTLQLAMLYVQCMYRHHILFN